MNILENSESSLDETVRANSGLVWSVVRRFALRGYEQDDLYQIGCMGLIKAAKRFDKSYGVQFSTYAVPLITGEIKRFLRDDGPVKVSRHYKEISIKASAVRAKLEKLHMREPSISEIASELGIDVFELTEAMEACMPCDYIYRTVSDNGRNEMYLIDKLFNQSEISMSDKAALSCALDSLTEREKAIITYRYFMDETQAKVAKRLGISQVQISRLEKKILAHLREKLSL